MLNKIVIKNYENHKETIIEPSSMVTIISGDSNNGKSGSQRGCIWAINNRPSGYEPIKPWNAKNKDVTEVILEFDDVRVSKRRSDDFHEYRINEQKPLIAFGTGVPEEVTDALNLGTFNIQGQHDRFFFIGENSSERARMLNEIAGLEIIDKSTSKINSIVTETNNKIKKVDKEIKETKDNLKNFESLDRIEKLILEIESSNDQIEKIEKENKIIEKIINEISAIDSFISEKKSLLINESNVVRIKEDIVNLLNIESKTNLVSKTISNLEHIEIIIAKYIKYGKIENDFGLLNKKLSEYNVLLEQNKTVENIIQRIETCEKSIQNNKKYFKVENIVEQIRDLKNQFFNMEKFNIEMSTIIQNIEKNEIRWIKEKSKLTMFLENKSEIWNNLDLCPTCMRKL